MTRSLRNFITKNYSREMKAKRKIERSMTERDILEKDADQTRKRPPSHEKKLSFWPPLGVLDN